VASSDPSILAAMSREQSISRRLIRRWQYLVGLLFIVYAAVIPDPHAFNNASIDRATWAVAGLLFLWAGLHPTRAARLTAMLAAVGLFAVRVTVLCYYPSDLSTARIAAGAVVWTTMTALLIVSTFASEMFDTPARFDSEQ
jgi:hypothetical protein